MKISAAALACVLATAANAAPSSKGSNYALKERHVVPAHWTQLNRAPKDNTIHLRIGLKQKSFDELERELYEVSDPVHERYGQHLSTEDVHRHTAPSEKSLKAVHAWLEENNISLDRLSYSAAKDWVTVRLPVSAVEDLLDTEYHVYEDAEGEQVIRTPHYSLPLALHEHIDLIQPTNYFGKPKALTGKPFLGKGLTYIEEGHEWYPPGYNPQSPPGCQQGLQRDGRHELMPAHSL